MRSLRSNDGNRKVAIREEGARCMLPHIRVNNIEVAVARVKTAGGVLVGDIADGSGFGPFATSTDPRGVRIGLHQE